MQTIPYAFEFDAADLAANRAGQLSAPQQERVTQLYRQYRRMALEVPVGIIVAIPIIYVISSLFVGWNLESFIGGVELALPALLVIGGLAAIAVIRMLRNLKQGRIFNIQGQPTLQVEMVGDVPRVYHMQISRKKFHLPPEQGKLLNPDQDYRVYYLAFLTNVILSYEVVTPTVS